jgi:hypothetical protein
VSELDLTAAIARATTYVAGPDAHTCARTAVEAAAPIIERQVCDRIARKIRDFAPDALADGDTPDAVLGLLTAAVIADGTGLTREQLTGQLDVLLMRDASAPAEATALPADSHPRDIHAWFELTYANYLVLPRALMQSMPDHWQHRATGILDELRAAYAHIEWPHYKVIPGRWCYLDDLSDADLRRAGVTWCCDSPAKQAALDELAVDGPVDDHRCTYHAADGDELDHNTACVFMAVVDPVPHYDRGRTHVPRADEIGIQRPTTLATAPPTVTEAGDNLGGGDV